MPGKLTVAVSVGGTKIGVGAVDSRSVIVAHLSKIPTPKEKNRRYEVIAEQVAAISKEIGLKNISAIGVSYPKCVPPPARVIADPDGLPAGKSDVQERIENAVFQRIGNKIPIEVLHDAAAAVLGEVSIRGTLPYSENVVFIVWGTGVASGVIHKGNLYWDDPEIGMMTGEIGQLVVRNGNGDYEHRPSRESEGISLPEESLDHRHCGPAIVRRFVERIAADPRGEGLACAIGKPIAALDLFDINRAARGSIDLAIELIRVAGLEMGKALAPYIYYWRHTRGMSFIENIIVGSGVANMGDGVEQDGRGLLIGAIRDGIHDRWTKLGAPEYDYGNVILSRIGYEREFYAFVP